MSDAVPGGPAAGAGLAGRIVHVTADFPDMLQPAKTRAIESLVRMVDDRFDNQVISLNRTGSTAEFARGWLARPFRPKLEVDLAAQSDDVQCVSYHAPPLGIFHATMLRQLGEWLAERIAAGPRPALLVGHKLTVEGIAVRRAAELLGIPYALSIQGNTDLKIAMARPDLRNELGRCFHGAAVVMPFAPWAQVGLEQRLGERNGPTVIVPCPVANDAAMAPVPTGNGLATAFHLRHHRLKNLSRMAAASDRLARRHEGAGLAVIGGGSPEHRAECERIARRHPSLRLEGPLPLEAMPARLNRASGFILASRRESFGLVFIEALLAGVPIAYPANLAIDGYFDNQPFALRVDNRATGSIFEAMERLLREEHALKRALAEWQEGEGVKRFRRVAIARVFGDALAMAAGSGAAT